MNTNSKLIYHFTLPKEYKQLIDNGHKLILCDFDRLALDYFIKLIGSVPAPWPLGPAANEEDNAHTGFSDTSNFCNWKNSDNHDKLLNLLGIGTRIDFGWRECMLIPVDNRWELIKSIFLDNTFGNLKFSNTSDAVVFSKLADSVGWCGAYLYHQGFWLIVCGKELALRLDSRFGYHSASGAILTALCSNENDFLDLEFWSPKTTHKF